MSNFLTIHQLVSLPWSNLNRDDSGTPKRLIQGGVMRGQLSSQSIKRAARTYYEEKSQNISIRSANLANEVAERARRINPELDEKTALKLAQKAIGTLTKGADKDKQDSNRSVWLSDEELEAAALAVADQDEEGFADGKFAGAGRTGALSIAAFGRMFANAPQQNVEAAIAVSPAVSTHAALLENDYFTTADDSPTVEQGSGATFLGLAQFTNGVFYRSTTIDRAQLKHSWTGFEGEATREQLFQMVDAVIYALPKGKKNSTAPYVMPDFILAEEQAHRIAYDFEAPVVADSEAGGGYMGPSIDKLVKQYEAARRFDPDNFAGVNLVSGVHEKAEGFPAQYVTKKQLIEAVVDWILQ